MQLIPFVLIPLVLDSLFLFLSGIEHSATVWVGFAVANVSYVLLVLSGNKKGHSAVLKISERLISLTHFLIQLSIFLLSNILGWFSLKTVITFHTLAALCFAVVFLISRNVSNKETREEERYKEQYNYLKAMQMKIDNFRRTTIDPTCKKALERLSDDLQSTQFCDSPVVRELEKSMQSEVDRIQDALFDEKYDAAISSIHRMTQLLRQRDMEIRANH